MPTNRDIDATLLAAGTWEIDPEYGLEQLNAYLSELELRRQGVPYEELGIAKRREQQRPAIIDCQGQQLSFGSEALSDTISTPRGSFAHIQVDGVMRVRDGISSRGIRQTARDIRAANANPHIDGILLEVDSGGGEAQAGTMLQQAVEETGKPVVVLARNLLSAAAKGTLPADRILAAGPDSRFGSIGTMASINRRFIEVYKSIYDDIYAEGSSLKNEEFRSYLQGDKGPIIRRLNTSNDIFTDQVRRWRPLATSGEVAAGQSFNGRDAVAAGLADAVGSYQGAVRELSRLSNTTFQKRRPVGAGQNSNSMDFKEFIQKALPFLNAKTGAEIKEDATAEEVIKALQDAPGTDELQKQIDELKEQSKGQAGSGDIDDILKKLKQIEGKVDQLEKDVDKVKQHGEEVAQEVAAIKAGRQEKKEKNTKEAPNGQKFNTVQRFHRAMKPGGNSKY